MDPKTQLSKNFQLWEFTASLEADKRGIANIPTAAQVENLRTLCAQILQPARDALGALRINSGFRSLALNKAVKGASNSDHLSGFAADVHPLNVGTREFAEWVVAYCKKFDQVILEFGTDESPKWIHVSASPLNRKQVLRATMIGTKTKYNSISLAKPNGSSNPLLTKAVKDPELRLETAKMILSWEARRDSQKRLAVYKLPEGDGGGSYEVAGINEKYNPTMAAKLKGLIEDGKFDEAEAEAIKFIAKDTDKVLGWSGSKAVEAFLRDSCFNRGKTGAARIYQLALKVYVDGDVGSDTMTAAQIAETHPDLLLENLRRSRERYERDWVNRNETSKFWKGLVSRWDKALKFSQTYLEPEAEHVAKVFAGELKVYSTVEWGARPPRRTNFEQNKAKGIVVHHMASANRTPLVGQDEIQASFRLARDCQIDHLKRQDSPISPFWSDTGQNFTISRGGIILEGRYGSLTAAGQGRVVRGAHAHNSSYNKTSFGIELEGNNIKEFVVTPEQWSALVSLCAWLAISGGFDPFNIRGHKEVSDTGTDCPGKVFGQLPRLKDEVKATMEHIQSGF
ncbi:MAG: D-Ala-D-Ala carboxypeptidase family metallohydrolase [Pyrinomonadaceae bacterium]